jgi:hypothetical protein
LIGVSKSSAHPRAAEPEIHIREREETLTFNNYDT